MHQKRKKIVATCMIVYMGTLALPQTPAYGQENETAVKEPAGEHASTNTAMPEMIGTAGTVQNDTQDETVLDGEGETATDPTEEAAENETVEETKDAENTEGTKGQEDTADVSGDEETANNDADEQKEPSSDTHETINEEEPTGALANALTRQSDLDYAKDLLIAVEDSITIQTPTITGSYDEGAAGDYTPGKDYSAADDVSKGTSVLYDVAFSFASQTQSDNYVIDSVKVVAVDENGNELGKKTPVYRIEDNSQTEQMAAIKDIQWDKNAGFVTGGTAKMTLAVELPQAIYWDTQIAPRIKLQATVQGTTVDSDIINLPAVKLSSQAIMNHHFTDGSSQKVEYNQEKKVFTASFKFYTGLEAKADIIGLLDRPRYQTQAYQFAVEAIIDKNQVAGELRTESFVVEPGSGMELAGKEAISYDPESKILTVTMRPTEETAPQKCDTAIYVEVPHVLAGATPHGLEHQVSVKLTMPEEAGVTFTEFENTTLFEQQVGSNWTTAGNLQCPDEAEAAEGAPWFTESIATSNRELGTLTHSVSFKNMGLDEDGYITIYQVLPHRLAYLAGSGKVSVEIEGNESSSVEGVEVLYGWSGQLMDIGQAGKGTQTDYSVLQQELQNGDIPLTDYDTALTQEHYPNIRAYRFKAPALEAGQKVTYTIDGASYARLPEGQINRQAIWHEGRIVSLVSLPVEDNEENRAALEAGLNKSMDTIQTVKGGKTYLNLGASKYNDERIQRFQAMSVPRSSAQIQDYSDELVLSMVDQQGTVCKNIDDYGQSYSLQLLKTTKYVNGNVILKKGMTVTYTLPEQLVPYVTMSEPYIMAEDKKIAMSEFSFDRENHTFSLTLPEDLLLTQKGKDGLYINLQFAQPTETMQFSKGALQVAAEGTIQLNLADEAKIMNGYQRSVSGLLG